jgi:hypothetical protein
MLICLTQTRGHMTVRIGVSTHFTRKTNPSLQVMQDCFEARNSVVPQVTLDLYRNRGRKEEPQRPNFFLLQDGDRLLFLIVNMNNLSTLHFHLSDLSLC